MQVRGARFSDVKTNAADRVRSGTQVRLADADGTTTAWDFRAGRTASLNEVKVADRGPAQVNTGNAPFFHFVVTYDVNRGEISLTPANWAPPVGSGTSGG